MSTFIMLTRLAHGGLRSPRCLKALNNEIQKRVRKECPDVSFVDRFALLGPADYLDIFTAPSLETALKVATIVRTYGHASTEIWGATRWDEFARLIQDLPGASVSERTSS